MARAQRTVDGDGRRGLAADPADVLCDVDFVCFVVVVFCHSLYYARGGLGRACRIWNDEQRGLVWPSWVDLGDYMGADYGAEHCKSAAALGERDLVDCVDCKTTNGLLYRHGLGLFGPCLICGDASMIPNVMANFRIINLRTIATLLVVSSVAIGIAGGITTALACGWDFMLHLFEQGRCGIMGTPAMFWAGSVASIGVGMKFFWVGLGLFALWRARKKSR